MGMGAGAADVGRKTGKKKNWTSTNWKTAVEDNNKKGSRRGANAKKCHVAGSRHAWEAGAGGWTGEAGAREAPRRLGGGGGSGCGGLAQPLPPAAVRPRLQWALPVRRRRDAAAAGARRYPPGGRPQETAQDRRPPARVHGGATTATPPRGRWAVRRRSRLVAAARNKAPRVDAAGAGAATGGPATRASRPPSPASRVPRQRHPRAHRQQRPAGPTGHHPRSLRVSGGVRCR